VLVSFQCTGKSSVALIEQVNCRHGASTRQLLPGIILLAAVVLFVGIALDAAYHE
jgi:hypothetical protein